MCYKIGPDIIFIKFSETLLQKEHKYHLSDHNLRLSDQIFKVYDSFEWSLDYNLSKGIQYDELWWK